MKKNDLNIIDALEKLKSYLFALDPLIERKRESLLLSEVRFDPGYVLEAYVAVCLGMDMESAPARRLAQKIRSLLIEGNQKEDKFCIKQEIPSDYAVKIEKLGVTKIRQRWQRLNKLFQIKSFQKEISKAPLKAINRLFSSRTGFKRINAYRFLSILGAPVVIVSEPKLRFVFRLGWVEEIKRGEMRLQQYQNICLKASRISRDSVLSIDYLFSLFAQRQVRPIRGIPVCGKNPLCEKCVLSSYCLYAKYHGTVQKKQCVHAPISLWRPEDRPRERLERVGASQLSTGQLLAIILGVGSEKQTALDLSEKLLQRFGSLRALESASLKEICKIKGIGKAKATRIKACLEIGKRFIQKKDTPTKIILDSKTIFDLYKLSFSSLKQETFVLLVLNSRNQVTKEKEIFRGSLNASMVHPREIFREAIKESACSVVFIHNHPSGDPTPSRADILITERLKETGKVVGISVLDHIIVGEEKYYSFADQGLI